jgi:hypothetical protein
MRIHAVWFFVALLALAVPAQSQKITNLYSSLDSADVTVEGDVSGYSLRMDLISDGHVLQTKSLGLDGPGTWIVRWRSFEAEEGSYDVCATLLSDETPLSKRCYNFFYGGRTPIRFDVRDFYADSRGMRLSISASDPTIVDIYYMLISDGRAVYVSRDRAVPIAGGALTPLQIDYQWKQLLENGQKYTGRAKIVELNFNQTRAVMNDFTAVDDAEITETYEDETGASATVLGKSRVPFEGSLRFVLSQNGTNLAVVEKKTPVLLAGDDETVEITWNQTLDPGLYQLSVVLLGNDGDVRDLSESIIEAEPLARPVNTTSAKSPLFALAGPVALAAAFFLWRLKNSHQNP